MISAFPAQPAIHDTLRATQAAVNQMHEMLRVMQACVEASRRQVSDSRALLEALEHTLAGAQPYARAGDPTGHAQESAARE